MELGGCTKYLDVPALNWTDQQYVVLGKENGRTFNSVRTYLYPVMFVTGFCVGYSRRLRLRGLVTDWFETLSQ